MPKRKEQILNVLASNNADFYCLQEVSEMLYKDILAYGGYDYYHYCIETELFVMSRYPIVFTSNLEYSMEVRIQIDNKILSVVNLHLPWRSALERERAIVDIVNSLDVKSFDYSFIVGDFNCSENSSVKGFLKGEQSLFGCDALYFDLAESFADRCGVSPSITLDFRKNPRWRKNGETISDAIEINQRYDRILLNNCFPKALPKLICCDIFGAEVSEATDLAASDHYGVFADLDLKDEIL